jgi:hypothetical protein
MHFLEEGTLPGSNTLRLNLLKSPRALASRQLRSGERSRILNPTAVSGPMLAILRDAVRV